MTGARHGFKGMQGVPDLVPIHNSSPVKVLDVACPDCSAAEGNACLMSDGKPRPTHPSRRRMAVRKVNLQRQENPADYIWTLEHWQRQQVRIDAGLTLEGAAKFFGVKLSTFHKIEKGERRIKDALAVAYGAWLHLRHEVAA